MRAGEETPALGVRTAGFAETVEVPGLLDEEAPLLVIEAGAGVRELIELQEGVAVVGSEGDVVLAGAADRHLSFERQGPAVEVRPLAPVERNGGSWQGGLLENGDVLQAGAARMHFVAPGGVVHLARSRGAAVGRWAAWACAGLLAGYLAGAAFSMARRDAAAGAVAARTTEQAPVVATPACVPPIPQPSQPPAHELEGPSASPAPPASEENEALERAGGDGGPRAAPPAAAAEVARSPEAWAERSPAARAAVRSEVARSPSPREETPRRVLRLPRRATPSAPASPPRERAAVEAEPVSLLPVLRAAWEAGALDEAVALGREAAAVEAQHFASRVERFARALSRVRESRGVAAAPALEEALGWAEEIGGNAPQVVEVRRALAALHRSAAHRAEEGGDLRGALHHCEQALAVLPGDPEAAAIRKRLAGSAGPIFLEGYALQHLDPAGALQRFELAARLALPGDPWAAKAAAWTERLRRPASPVEAAGQAAPAAL